MIPLLALWAATATSAAAPPDVDYLDRLVARAHQQGLAQDPTWRALLHYEPRAFGGWKSTADAPSFFAADDGQTDPEAELDATLAVFFAPPVEESEALQHPQCRFRARYRWLAERLGFDPSRLPPQPCARFEWWKKTIRAEGATLVFAAAYLNNPASMFGHTFLRLDRSEGGAADLLAYTVNFAAVPSSFNPLVYTVLGLAGGFPGIYSTLPYYLKVKEYSSLEHRDLWEYQLDLRPDELARMVAHLWELGNVHFDYYYLDENCAYQLLSLLEVARPSLGLTRRFRSYAIPTDTIRAVAAEPGLIKARHHRPSQQAILLARRGLLTSTEAETALAWAEGAAPNPGEARREAVILDAALQLLQFRAGGDPDEVQKARARQLLLRRGRLGTASAPLEIPAGAPPEQGHGTALLGVGGGVGPHGGFLRLEGRIALHDRLQRGAGYVRGSQIELFRVGLRLPIEGDAEARPELDQLRVLEIFSLAPLDRWAFRWSWRIGTGLWPQRDRGCVGTRCWAYGVGGGPGLAFELGAPELLAYAFVDGQLALGPVFRDNYRVGLGGTAGLQLEPWRRWRWSLEASYLFPVLGDERHDGPYRLSAGSAFDLADNVEFRAEAIWARGDEELRAAFNFGF